MNKMADRDGFSGDSTLNREFEETRNAFAGDHSITSNEEEQSAAPHLLGPELREVLARVFTALQVLRSDWSERQRLHILSLTYEGLCEEAALLGVGIDPPGHTSQDILCSTKLFEQHLDQRYPGWQGQLAEPTLTEPTQRPCAEPLEESEQELVQTGERCTSLSPEEEARDEPPGPYWRLEEPQTFQHHPPSEEVERGGEHPSGAIRIPRAYAFQPPFIWFSDCLRCTTGTTFLRYNDFSNAGEMRQCFLCYRRYLQWLKEHGWIRYEIARSNYPVRLRIDTSKSLTRSQGRIFYHEVDYTARECEGARVIAYALDAKGNRLEQLSIEGGKHFFSTLEAAQAWIAEQLGGSLSRFWLS